MRVYPPGRVSKRGAIVSNSLPTTSRSWMSRSTSRRAWSDLPLASPPAMPRLAMVISRSTKGRSSFAFGIVVSMRSCRMSAIAWLRSSAVRCSLTRPSLRYARLCLIAYSLSGSGIRDPGPATVLLLRSCRLIHAHAEAQPHAVQDLLDLVQRFAAEVLRLEHLGLGFLHQFANGADVRVLQAVV